MSLNKRVDSWGGTSEPPPNDFQIRNLRGASPSTSNCDVSSQHFNVIESTDTTVVCSVCSRSFNSKIGLGLHKKKAHPAEYNEDITTAQVKPRWTKEEVSLLAMEEALAPPQTDAMNLYLYGKHSGTRSIEAIKGVRKKQEYKRLVDEYKEEILTTAIDELSDAHEAPESNLVQEIRVEDHTSNVALNWLLAKQEDIIPEMNGGIWIRAAIERIRNNLTPDECLEEWWKNVFPDLVEAHGSRVSRRSCVRVEPSRRRARRREYRRMQTLWRKNMSKAAHKVLDGDADGLPHPTLSQQMAFWRPILEAGPLQTPQWDGGSWQCRNLGSIWAPITEAEVINIRLPRASAPGIDGMTVHRWFTEVPAVLRASLFNIFMAARRVPSGFRDSRTVLIPKSPDYMDPSNYRPISVASVILRHFHKILAKRLMSHDIFDVRQRAFMNADGCAENVAVLSAVLHEARRSFRQLHVIALDVRKAFDTVSHLGIYTVLKKIGCPGPFIEYINALYNSANTRLEVDREYSENIRPRRGVRQGDPLSPVIFNLIMNEILIAVPQYVGFDLYGHNINVLAFADDVLLFASTKEGAQKSLDGVMESLRSFGLELAPSKCAAFSLLPSGKAKKIKVLTEQQFHIAGRDIPQLDNLDSMRYLGIHFDARGPLLSSVDLGPSLDRITRAPLKPQQRIKILKVYLIPRFIHGLVLGRISHASLRKLDRQIRAAVRRWLRLPNDITKSFFHASNKQGGLGIMSFESSVPRLTRNRLDNLRLSTFPIVREIADGDWANQRRSWCRMAKVRDNDWPALLYRSVDGFELREAGDVTASTAWLDDPMIFVPPSDWIQYIKIWVNAIPTRIRTTRGTRRLHEDVLCRAGCAVQETAAHVIQQCFRTHGGRVMRHDAVAATVAAELQRGGYKVRREHVFKTREGVRKPDILAVKGERGYILDAQIVSGARSLHENHLTKRQYYANNKDLVDQVADLLQVTPTNLTISTVTLTWRGIWAKTSATTMDAMGVSRIVQRGITTRTLKGSYTNFVRFNQMTAVSRNRANLHMSGWGPPR